MLYITRKEHFSSSHKIHNPKLKDIENEKIFGKCNNFHGHNYYIEVTVCGKIDKRSGYVMDIKILKDIIQKEIIEKVDHKYLNDVEMFSGKIITTENMAMVFWEILKKKINLKGVKLYSIKIFETEKNIVLYKGE